MHYVILNSKADLVNLFNSSAYAKSDTLYSKKQNPHRYRSLSV